MRTFLCALIALFVSTTAQAEVLKYEPAVVSLHGALQSAQGRTPDEESVSFPAMKLNTPVRVEADPNNDLTETEDAVSLVQLVLTPELLNEYEKAKGREATVTGTLVHAHTGHHYTKVLLVVRKIEP